MQYIDSIFGQGKLARWAGELRLCFHCRDKFTKEAKDQTVPEEVLTEGVDLVNILSSLLS